MKLWQLLMQGPQGPTGAWQYSVREKLALLAVAWRQKVRPRRNLVAGPFGGEFGWELMQWQSYVRARRPHYQEVHVLTYPGRDPLYEGCTLHYHDIALERAGFGYGRLHFTEARRLAQGLAEQIGLKDYDILEPSVLCTRYHKRVLGPPNFRVFQEPPLRPEPLDIAFHFRAVTKQGPDQENKNYLPELADQLYAECVKRGISACCIGHPQYSHCPAGCLDFRSLDLRQTLAAISTVRAVAGENSGPMHLANLCGKPTVVWAKDQWRIDYSLRWNPFRVPIYIAANNSAQPPPPVLAQAITDALQDMRQKSRNFTVPLHTFPAQPIAFS